MPTHRRNGATDADDTTASSSGFSGPRQRPRDRSPEHAYKPKPGDNNNRTDAEAPGGPVQIKVKGQPAKAGPSKDISG